MALLTASMLSSSHFAWSDNELPNLGTAAASTLTIDQENELGDIYMRVQRASRPVVYDPLLNQYITELGNKLVAHAQDVKTPFKFFLIQNDEINAFAFFGGHVGIHTGLFLNANNESELASVYAHEIAHVTQRHLARAMEARARSNPAMIAGLLGSLLLTIAAPEAGMAALATTTGIARQTQINYTRSNEQEADRIGMHTLVDSGFDPDGAYLFFNKLARKYQYATRLPEILQSHPLPKSRITEARNRAAKYPHRYIPASLEFQLAKARVQVRFSDLSPSATLAMFNKQLKLKTFVLKDAALYGKALALFELDKIQQSSAIIKQLLNHNPDNLFYIDTKTDLLIKQKKYQQAITMLEAQYQDKPASQVIAMNLAHAYIEAEKSDKAIPILQDAIFYEWDNMVAYQLLLDAYSKTDNPAMEHYIQAEIMALQANYDGAIDQLNYAHKNSQGDPLQLARIEARIRQFRQYEIEIKKLSKR
ncbi:M48 family peptidase [Parashewanella curva]|uniref:Putative beta-barrel assembly-enhancing protease n=1 Tax=Parashewanella curva TaxID=2338552 RepID=A0A3L8Q2P1_9GAMM|nr:M48 family metalloprotease [Parashewanella curva]RLV61279.1 M48 family peptidase [Parashewanella curva]